MQDSFCTQLKLIENGGGYIEGLLSHITLLNVGSTTIAEKDSRYEWGFYWEMINLNSLIQLYALAVANLT